MNVIFIDLPNFCASEYGTELDLLTFFLFNMHKIHFRVDVVSASPVDLNSGGTFRSAGPIELKYLIFPNRNITFLMLLVPGQTNIWQAFKVVKTTFKWTQDLNTIIESGL